MWLSSHNLMWQINSCHIYLRKMLGQHWKLVFAKTLTLLWFLIVIIENCLFFLPTSTCTVLHPALDSNTCKVVPISLTHHFVCCYTNEDGYFKKKKAYCFKLIDILLLFFCRSCSFGWFDFLLYEIQITREALPKDEWKRPWGRWNESCLSWGNGSR